MDFEAVPEAFHKVLGELDKIIVGQREVIEQLFMGLLCRGHVLIVGVPGLAKTTIVNSFAKSLGLEFNRIQFTPDLMPSDIIGTEILQENQSTRRRELIFNKGPLFTNILLADEINRTPPKTQSALLQAMQERIVTVSGQTERLGDPFMVMATQNPIEQEGTYPLPEAQLDRFLFNIEIEYPEFEEELQIVKKHSQKVEAEIQPVLSQSDILAMQKKLLEMTVSEHIYQKAVKLARSTRPSDNSSGNLVKEYVSWGAGPRASTYLILAAKARALLEGIPTPTEAHLEKILHPTLNHRLLLNFQAEAEGVNSKKILKDLK